MTCAKWIFKDSIAKFCCTTEPVTSCNHSFKCAVVCQLNSVQQFCVNPPSIYLLELISKIPFFSLIGNFNFKCAAVLLRERLRFLGIAPFFFNICIVLIEFCVILTDYALDWHGKKRTRAHTWQQIDSFPYQTETANRKLCKYFSNKKKFLINKWISEKIINGVPAWGIRRQLPFWAPPAADVIDLRVRRSDPLNLGHIFVISFKSNK